MKNIKHYTDHLKESQETPKELGQRLVEIISAPLKTPDIEEVKRLIAAGADLEAKSLGGGGWTSLHYAAAYGRTEAAKALIGAGADLEARDENDWTPLHLAAAARRTEIGKALIQAGADISAEFDSLDKLDDFFGGDIDWIPQESLPPEWRKRQRARGAFGRF